MTPFRPAVYTHPYHHSSSLIAPLPFSSPALGQTFDQQLELGPAMGDVIRLFFHGMTAYLGIYVGQRETGFLSFFGWFLGIGQGVGALLDVVSLVQRIAGTHPPES